MSDDKRQATAAERPFWLKPPWMVLFDLIKLHRVRPWDVNISYLLDTLIVEMKKRGFIDFTASGVALLSSSTIYRMKTELILQLEEPPKPPPERPEEALPPPIQLPYRYEYKLTTFDSLLGALEDALKGEALLDMRPKLMPITPAPPMVQEIDQFMVNIEENIDRMYERIMQLTKEEPTIPFSRLTTSQRRIDIVRSFILVLFIACRGKIQLWQDQEFGEIYLGLSREGEATNDESGEEAGED